MRDSLAFRGSALWNLIYCKNEIGNSNFKEIKYCLLPRSIFKTFFLTVQLPRSTSQYRDSDYVYFFYVYYFFCPLCPFIEALAASPFIPLVFKGLNFIIHTYITYSNFLSY